MDWPNVFSGLLGAVIGSIATLAGSIWAANRTVKGSVMLADREREERERIIMLSSASGLLAEIRDNLRILGETPDNHTLVPFLDDMWEVHKGNLSFLPLATQENIRKGYASVVFANATATRDLYQLEYNQGFLEGQYKTHSQNTKEPFEYAQKELEDYLKKA